MFFLPGSTSSVLFRDHRVVFPVPSTSEHYNSTLLFASVVFPFLI
jgi:hypothetical protein